MKASKLREMTVEELRQKDNELRKELLHLRIQKATGDIQNPNRLKEIKRDIARVLTIITEKQSGSPKNH
ncbi:MAG: 50S ribosomal protein L29 [Thermodesulfovibrionales bacterium]